MFGADNALFSGPAFSGVIYAILIHSGELFLQRQELGTTVEELRRSANAQEEVKKEMLRQAHIRTCAVKVQALAGLIDNLNHYERLYPKARGQSSQAPCPRERRAPTIVEGGVGQDEEPLT